MKNHFRCCCLSTAALLRARHAGAQHLPAARTPIDASLFTGAASLSYSGYCHDATEAGQCALVTRGARNMRKVLVPQSNASTAAAILHSRRHSKRPAAAWVAAAQPFHDLRMCEWVIGRGVSRKAKQNLVLYVRVDLTFTLLSHGRFATLAPSQLV